MSVSCVRIFAHRYTDQQGPALPAPPPIPPLPRVTRSIAVSLPSRSTPILTFCSEFGRLPVDRCSSARGSITLTGTPVALASRDAIIISGVAPNFDPKPPPRYSQTTRTLSGGKLKYTARSSRTEKTPWVEHQTVS